jgi:histidine triad (HIT) family protein
MNDCVFCRIVGGNMPASVVYEDDETLAFLDLRQPSAAHVLVVPKLHIETIFDLEPELSARLMLTVVLTARAVRESLGPAGVNIWQSNGHAAGQEVPHVHMHVLAREVGDGLFPVYSQPPPLPERESLDQLAITIRAGFGALSK